ncbi:MFS transporter [Gordonia humi]
MFGFTGTALLTVLYLQHAQGVSALGAGVRTLVMFVPFILLSPVAARLAQRIGFKFLLSIGLAIMSAGIFLLLFAVPGRDFAHLWPGLFVVGVGSGLLIAPSTAAAIISVRHEQAGMASSAVNMFRQLGNVLGASVLGTILTTGFASRLGERLTDAGLPGPTADTIVDGAENGASTAGLPPAVASVVDRAVTVAFTDAFHVGVLVAAIVVLAVVVPTLVWVRHRPAS